MEIERNLHGISEVGQYLHHKNTSLQCVYVVVISYEVRHGVSGKSNLRRCD